MMKGFQNCRLLPLVALLCGIHLMTAEAAPVLSDGPGGVTCHHFASDGLMAWSRPGGDWRDRDGLLHGGRAYAQGAVPLAAGALIRIELPRAFLQAGEHPRGQVAVMLRKTPGGGTFAIHARESADLMNRPALEVELKSGERRLLDALADSVIDCSTRSSLGTEPEIKISNSQSALLLFDLGKIQASDILRGALLMSTARTWGRVDGQLEVFAASLPGQGGASTTALNGLSARYSGDKGIENDPAVIFVSRFESRRPDEGWTTFGTGSLVELANEADKSVGFNPLQGAALQVAMRPTQNLGLDLRYDFRKAGKDEPDEAYMRYYLLLGHDFQPDVDGGKLPGFAGTYGQGGWGMRGSNGLNGWSARGGFARLSASAGSGPRPVSIGTYVYHADQADDSGEYWGWNLGPTGRLETGRWYAIEQYVRLNTPGKRDGVFRAWIDGELAFERSGLRFRDIEALHIENAWFNVYHGGTAKPARDMSLYIDNVVIAREYIGPMLRP